MSPLKILIVEDDAFIAIDLEDQVVALNHEVVGTAPTARQAIEKARATQPDLALMDLRLYEVRKRTQYAANKSPLVRVS